MSVDDPLMRCGGKGKADVVGEERRQTTSCEIEKPFGTESVTSLRRTGFSLKGDLGHEHVVLRGFAGEAKPSLRCVRLMIDPKRKEKMG